MLYVNPTLLVKKKSKGVRERWKSPESFWRKNWRFHISTPNKLTFGTQQVNLRQKGRLFKTKHGLFKTKFKKFSTLTPTHSVFWRLPWVIFGWITCRYLTNVVNQSLDKSFCLPRDKWLCQSGSKRDIRSVARSFDMETNKSAAFL